MLPGRVMYELQGVDEKTAREAFRLAGHKLPIAYKFLARGEIVMKAADLREKSVEDLRELEKTLARDVFQNRLKNFTNRLDDTSSIRKTKRDLARVITVLQERALSIARVGRSRGHIAEGRGEARRRRPPRRKAKAAAAAARAEEGAAKKSAAKKRSQEE